MCVSIHHSTTTLSCPSWRESTSGLGGSSSATEGRRLRSRRSFPSFGMPPPSVLPRGVTSFVTARGWRVTTMGLPACQGLFPAPRVKAEGREEPWGNEGHLLMKGEEVAYRSCSKALGIGYTICNTGSERARHCTTALVEVLMSV